MSLVSCDDDLDPHEEAEEIDCEYCFQEMSEFVDLTLMFNNEKSDSVIAFTIYSGFAFESEVYMEGVTNNHKEYVEVRPDQLYTVVAEYYVDGNLYYVINDCKVKTEYFKSACDKPCYYVYEEVCMLKLKDL